MGIPKLEIKLIDNRVAAPIIIRNHYSHTFPAGTMLAFGVFHEGALRGACCFGKGAAPEYVKLVEGTKRDEYLELTRLWLHDSLPKNSESFVIGFCLRFIKKHAPKIKWIISYADKNHNHLGTIYKATNFVYTGLGGKTDALILKGKRIHRRTIGRRFGTSDLKFFKKHGIEFEKTIEKGKHRYFYFLHSACREKLKLPILTYPALVVQEEEQPSFQGETGGAIPTPAHQAIK